MRIKCSHCGKSVAVYGIGRKPLDIPFKNISEALRAYRSVERASAELGCSIGYIYQELGKHGLKPKDIINQ